MLVAGIDPGARTGVAVLDPKPRPRVVKHWTARLGGDGIPLHAAVKAVVRMLVQLAGGDPSAFAAVAIEDQFLGKNPSTMARLVELRARFQQSLEESGFRVVTVRPETWAKSSIKGMVTSIGVMKAGAKRKMRKAAAVAWAQAVYGLDVGEDEADAIAIAHHALSECTFGGKIR